MDINLQPTLENELVILSPLKAEDFEALYQAASDPKIWEQHPNKDRWKREVFKNFFEGAMASGGAFKVIDKATGQIAGSTRYYDYDAAGKSILIGYTFFATRFWGRGLNPAAKRLMLDYIFKYVEKVHFHIGAANMRSQIAIKRLGASKIGEETVAYYGEPPKLNFVYGISRPKILI
ncbi:MAG TPA: GNAT family N-acetyltransferase [Puia sp.]|nr:GNAT family N-acetyltransferase [Puia sp.]